MTRSGDAGRDVSGILAGIAIIAEDRHFLVAYKPPNMPAQADSSRDRDMLSTLKDYIKRRERKPGNVYLALLHRLDRPAQGLLVFAKTSKAAARLSASQRDGEWTKEYLAVVRGNARESPCGADKRNVSESDAARQGCSAVPPRRAAYACGSASASPRRADGNEALACPADSEENSWLAWTDLLLKDERTNSSSIVPSGTPGAKEARLSWTCAGLYAPPAGNGGGSHGVLSLARIRLGTGRSHQIRVQFSARGLPLWGDLRYDPEQSRPGMQLALLAARLSFPHPITGECCAYTVSPPEERPWNLFGGAHS